MSTAQDAISREAPSRQPIVILLAPVVPDAPAYRTPAFSRAGNMFITNLVSALGEAGCAPAEIISFLPIPAFPRARRVWVHPEIVVVAGVRARLVGFLNLPVVKYAMISIAILIRVLGALRRRDRKRTVVYCYNAVSPIGPAGLLGARLMGVRAVVSVNDVWKPGALVPDSPSWRFDYWCQRKLIPRFDGAVVVSDAVMRDIAPNQEYLRIDGGVTDEVFESTRDHVTEGSEGAFTIVASGSLDEVNGFVELIEAFRSIMDERFRLIIAGGGPLESLVREAAAADERITYIGLLPFARVLALYASADLLVNIRLTRRIDSRYFFPSKLMEFLASGTPVISTCTGHLEAEYGDFVFLVRDETSRGIAEAIVKAAATPQAMRRDMGTRARSYMLNNKTWRAQAARIARFLVATIAKK